MTSTLLCILKRSTAIIPATFLATLVAHANPLDGQVVQGTATISAPDPSTLNVHQDTNKAIINWQSFDIGEGELTQFFLPDSSGVTLNRVVGSQNPSQILGKLKSNGTVMVVNPDGILFGPHSVIDVGILLATTSDVKDDDFMSGNYRFTKSGNPSASIINKGMITVNDEGVAALVAPGVRNEGIITARLGKVTLGAANKFTLDFYGDDLINLELTDELTGDVIDVSTGKPLDDRVSNSGKISADGGTVVLKAATVRKVVNSVINNTGVIEANSVGLKKGKIVLSAATATTKRNTSAPVQKVKISGTLKASGTKPKEKGGLIAVTGEQIELLTASLITNGDAGGGTILIGGDYLGGKASDQVMQGYGIAREANVVSTATTVGVDTASNIEANATSTGNGGKVVVWADDHTEFRGSISSKGGVTSGNGGFAEVSGHNTLHYDGLVNLSGYSGYDGTLLLDPLNVTIGGSGTSGLSVTLLQDTLANANVIVSTGATGFENGDIIVAADVAWAGANSLTLNAYRNINFNSGVMIRHTGSGDLILRADSSGTGVGTVAFAVGSAVDYSGSTGQVSILYSPTGAIKFQNSIDYTPFISGLFSSYMLVNDVDDLQALNTNLTGSYALGKNIDASGTSSWNGGAGFIPIGRNYNDQELAFLLENRLRELNGLPPLPVTFGLPTFRGIISGEGHVIDNLYINSTAQDVGLIGMGGTVRNVGLTNARVIAAGTNQNAGIISGQQTLIEDSFAEGTISGNRARNVGGLIGETGRDITQSRFAGSIVFNSAVSVGGLAGEIGLANVVSQSYSSGTIVVSGSNAGGLVGRSLGRILDSYSSMNVSAQFSVVGGLVGQGERDDIQNSFAVGALSGSNSLIGGVVGSRRANIGPYLNTYWDTVASGTAFSNNGTGQTTAQLKAALPAGFDPAVWGIDPAINDGYPYLLWETPVIAPIAFKFAPPFPDVTPPPSPPPAPMPKPDVGQGDLNHDVTLNKVATSKSDFNEIFEPMFIRHFIDDHISDPVKAALLRSLLEGGFVAGNEGKFNLDAARWSAVLSILAYEDESAVKLLLGSLGVQPVDSNFVHPIGLENGFGSQYILAKVVIDGKTEYIISIKGTESPLASTGVAEWLTDGLAAGVDVSKSIKLHQFFLQLAAAVQTDLLQNPEVVRAIKDDNFNVQISGHSLGGAAAQILSYQLATGLNGDNISDNIATYTIGAPLPGNSAFAAYVKAHSLKMYSIINPGDLVPKLGFGGIFGATPGKIVNVGTSSWLKSEHPAGQYLEGLLSSTL